MDGCRYPQSAGKLSAICSRTRTVRRQCRAILRTAARNGSGKLGRGLFDDGVVQLLHNQFADMVFEADCEL